MEKNNECKNKQICFNAMYTIVNSAEPAPKYLDGFICRKTDKPCTADHYQLK